MNFYQNCLCTAALMVLSMKLTAQQAPGRPAPVLPVFSLEQEQQKKDSIQKELTRQERAYTDSIQRTILQDSLGLPDTLVSRVFTIRNDHLLNVDRIYGDLSLSQGERSSMLQTLRKETTEAIRQLLGDETYDRYMRLVVGH
jgi:hypothetical protein